MLRTRILIRLLAGFTLILFPTFALAWERPPNVVIILCDNLGYGDIEPFGSTLHRTPHLNRMASEGRLFSHFYVSAGVCTPSRASLMTGCYAQRLGMHWTDRDGHVLRPISPYGIHPDEWTIAEMLNARGYSTAIFGKWHLGDQPEFLPTRHGFDEFLGIPYSDDMTREVGLRLGDRFEGSQWPPLPLMRDEEVIAAPVDRNELTKTLTTSAIEFIDRHQDEPFFLYFPQAMPGSTQAPFASEAFRGKSRNGPWGDSVEELDWSAGQILDALDERGLANNTLVIWMSDNGAPLARDTESLARGSNRPLHGRGYTTAEGAFRVPTIMWWPGRIAAGSSCDQLATSMDLMPTIEAIVDASSDGQTDDDIRPKPRSIDGLDISALLFGNETETTPHDAFFYYNQQQLQAVRHGPWKLFVPLDTFTRHPHFDAAPAREPLLFHLLDDPSCQVNVSSEHPQVVADMMAMADQARADLGDVGQAGSGQRAAGRVESPTPRTRSGD